MAQRSPATRLSRGVVNEQPANNDPNSVDNEECIQENAILKL